MPRPRTLFLPGIAVAVLAAAGTAIAVNATDRGETTNVQPPINQAIKIDSGDIDSARQLENDALAGTPMSIPADWNIVDVRQERHDDREVTVIRHQPDGYVLGGAHASLVLDPDGTILGYTRLAEQDADAALPDEDTGEQIALDFLRQVAPDYVDGLSVSWVDRHDETVTLPNGDAVTVSGMKVKMHHDNGLYAWVIVGADRSVLTFERDIDWDSGEGRRGTQMWLHDSWIAAHEGLGPQPEPPYALAGA